MRITLDQVKEFLSFGPHSYRTFMFGLSALSGLFCTWQIYMVISGKGPNTLWAGVPVYAGSAVLFSLAGIIEGVRRLATTRDSENRAWSVVMLIMGLVFPIYILIYTLQYC